MPTRAPAIADTMLAMTGERERIMVFLPTWGGDAVMFTPALRAIRARYSGADLALLARPAPAAVLRPNPWTEDIIVDRGSLLRLIRMLRRRRFDLAVLGPNSFRSALVARLGGAGRRLGYDRDGRGFLLTDRLTPPRNADGSFAVTPTLDYYLELAASLGGDVSDRRMELAVADSDAASAEALLEGAGVEPGRPIVLLNPGGSFGPAKLYPAERFADVADALAEGRKAQIIINAAPSERPIADAVAAAMKRPPALNLARIENTLGLLKALVCRADLLITNDTGPRHLAAALGVPVVTVIGPTDPGWAAIDYARERIVRVDVPCGPCQRKQCPLRPGPERHQCMLKISPEMVLAAAEELLNEEGLREQRRTRRSRREGPVEA